MPPSVTASLRRRNTRRDGIITARVERIGQLDLNDQPGIIR
jgi:hypothetical protein